MPRRQSSSGPYTAEVTRPGWTIGVGGEYAFTDFLSGFIEYGYYDFGTRQIGLTPQVAGLGPAFVDIKETRSVVRAGLNFRFGGDAARVAPNTEPARQAHSTGLSIARRRMPLKSACQFEFAVKMLA